MAHDLGSSASEQCHTMWGSVGGLGVSASPVSSRRRPDTTSRDGACTCGTLASSVGRRNVAEIALWSDVVIAEQAVYDVWVRSRPGSARYSTRSHHEGVRIFSSENVRSPLPDQYEIAPC